MADKRLLGATPFLWLADFARIPPGEAARRVPRREVPNLLVRTLARFDPALRSMVPELGRRHLYSLEKARKLLAWAPRPTLVWAAARASIAVQAYVPWVPTSYR